MSYWDTSTVVKLYVKEADSATFENYALNLTEPILSSRVALYEARATFHRKEAEGILQTGASQTLYNQLLQDVAAGELHLLDLDANVEREYGRAIEICYQYTPRILIRTLDAIHLASARAGGDREIVATDKRLRDAAKILGFSLFPP